MRIRWLILISIVAVGSGLLIYTVKANEMTEVKVDIGKNISETATRSGAPGFGIESHWGLKIYELVNLRPEVIVRYIRPGFEITATPLFSLTMYADSENKNNMAVEKIQLQYGYNAKSHKDGKSFFESIVEQFNKGRWKRFIDEGCPAISGRSSYLDIDGKIHGICALDPHYHISLDDWTRLTRFANRYEWLGDNVLAKLTVNYDEDSRGLTYNIDLEFQDFTIENRRNDAKLARGLAEGDQKGWKSTERYRKDFEENKLRIKILEKNAVKRGDHLLPRD